MRILTLLTGIFFLMYFSLQPLVDMFEKKPVVATTGDIVFVNNSGCFLRGRQSPARYTLAVEPINSLGCQRPQLLFAETKMTGNFLVSKKIWEDLQCKYGLLAARDFQSNKVLLEGHFNLRRGASAGIQIGVGQQIVRVECHNKANVTKYHDVHFFLPPPVPASKQGSEKLSVMVLGIDSISHMHFVRSFPYLNGFLENMRTKFFGYSRVGLDAHANVMPLLSGLSGDEADYESLFSTGAWLWESFKAVGYTTAFGEDNAEGVLPKRNGKWELPRQPTDFYLAPVLLEMNNHTRYSLDLREMVHCSAGRQFQEVLREFIVKLEPHMQQRPFFSFFWQSQGVQEYYEFARKLDMPYMMLLKSLQDSDILNNTILFLVSDHGLRAGDYRSSFQGMREESQPLLLAIYPDWLRDKYPMAMQNFERNSRSLTTPYDLHETLRDVSRLDELQNSKIVARTNTLQLYSPKKLPRGISLFLPIPDFRTCELAHIPSLFCFCRPHTEMPTDDGLVLRCSRFLVESINQLTKKHVLCRKLMLQTVLLAYFVDFGEESFIYELRLRVRTLPGNGEFEATVRLSDVMLLTSPINRVNRYLAQSYCVNDSHIKPLCFC